MAAPYLPGFSVLTALRNTVCLFVTRWPLVTPFPGFTVAAIKKIDGDRLKTETSEALGDFSELRSKDEKVHGYLASLASYSLRVF